MSKMGHKKNKGTFGIIVTTMRCKIDRIELDLPPKYDQFIFQVVWLLIFYKILCGIFARIM